MSEPSSEFTFSIGDKNFKLDTPEQTAEIIKILAHNAHESPAEFMHKMIKEALHPEHIDEVMEGHRKKK